MHYIFIDTCTWLDLAKKRGQEPLISVLENLVDNKQVSILSTELVKDEFERNKERVIKSSRQRLSQEFKLVKGIVKEFGGDNKENALTELDNIDTRLPILSEVTSAMADKIATIMKKGIQIEITDRDKVKATNRAIKKQAPFHKSKNSVADAVLIETFSSYVEKYQSEAHTFHFVTANYHDFSGLDKRKPHDDFNNIFKMNVHYSLSLKDTINLIDDNLLDEFEFEYGWEEETRGLNDILEAIDEFTDKVWYDRHMGRMNELEEGKLKVVPAGTEDYSGNVIHRDILDGALKSAARVKNKYEELGPWTDFEWGMLNGKLSALRWILGDEWDMLYT